MSNICWILQLQTHKQEHSHEFQQSLQTASRVDEASLDCIPPEHPERNKPRHFEDGLN